MAARAGLVREGQIEELLAEKTRNAEAAFLESLDEVDRIQAVEYLQQAKDAALVHWDQVFEGLAPRPQHRQPMLSTWGMVRPQRPREEARGVHLRRRTADRRGS